MLFLSNGFVLTRFFPSFSVSVDSVRHELRHRGMAFVLPTNSVQCVRNDYQIYKTKPEHWRKCQKVDWNISSDCCHSCRISPKIACIWMSSRQPPVCITSVIWCNIFVFFLLYFPYPRLPLNCSFHLSRRVHSERNFLTYLVYQI